jgi:hypothetical protein
MSPDEALEQAIEREARPLRSVGELVESYGGLTGRAAEALGVSPRTVERWVKAERGEPGETRRPPTERTKGLTADDRRVRDALRRLFGSPERRAAHLARRAKGRKVVAHYRGRVRYKNRPWYDVEGDVVLPGYILDDLAGGNLADAAEGLGYEAVLEAGFSDGLAASEDAEIDLDVMTISLE